MRGLTVQEYQWLVECLVSSEGPEEEFGGPEHVLSQELVTQGRMSVRRWSEPTDVPGYTHVEHETYSVTELGKLAVRLWPLNRI